MKRIITFIIIFGLFVSTCINIAANESKKRVVIFICKGGGGHISAGNASFSCLKKNNYEPKIVNPFCDSDLFGSIDFTKKLTFNRCACEDIYNFLLRNRCNWLINKLSNFGMRWLKNHSKKLKKIMLNYLKKNKPDMIISVIPFLNGVILDAAQELNIPVLILPTDLNAETFCLGIDDTKHDKFIFSLPFEDQLLIDKIKPFNIPKKNLRFIGYPLRQHFFEEKDVSKIKKEFNIPENKPVIMILMGAEGSNSIYTYVYNLSKSKMPMHLIVCIGRKEDLRYRLNKIRLPKHITISIISFTDRIADLMACSCCLITKGGSNSFCEGIQIGCNILLDQTCTCLQWEKLNGDFLKKHNLGDVIKSYRKVNKLVEKFVKDEKFKLQLNENLKKFKRKSFEEPFIEAVEYLLNNESKK